MEINSDSIKIVNQVYMRKLPDQLWYWEYLKTINQDDADAFLDKLVKFLKSHTGEFSYYMDNELFLVTVIYPNFAEYYENKKLRYKEFLDVQNDIENLKKYCENNGIISDFLTTFVEHMYHPWEKVHTPRPPESKILTDNLYGHPTNAS